MLLTLTLLLAAAGAAIAVWWISMTGGSAALQSGLSISAPMVAVMAAVTAANVVVRFVRWHFLLRRVDVKIPTRASLTIYLASLPAIATPAYAGEILRPLLMRRRFGVPIGRTLPVVVAERVCDAMALAAIGAVTAADRAALLALAGALAVLLLLVWAVALFGRRAPITAPIAERLTRASVLAPAVGLSLLAWLPAGYLFALAATATGEMVSGDASLQIFARATLVGGLSLMPAGIATTGSTAILALQELGLDLRSSVTIVSLVRAATVGLAVGVGLVVLVAELRRRRVTSPDSVEHFDEIASVYSAQLTPHVRDLLLTRKTGLLARRLAGGGQQGTRGLDLGCGLGTQALALAQHGYRVIGVEPSVRSVALARGAGATVAAASGESLPFADASFDFVYAVGVLHHMNEQQARPRAFAEIRRVLRPGGLLLVHETNPRNPLFRFYMGYVFPIARQIDEGTEQWLDPVALSIAGLEKTAIDYATFLPDFVPRSLLPLFLSVERRLEQSRLRHYSVHYLASFRKVAS